MTHTANDYDAATLSYDAQRRAQRVIWHNGRMIKSLGIEVGDTVSGRYKGMFPFSGTVTKRESDTTDATHLRYYVRLDSPIIAFGSSRDTIIVNSYINGSREESEELH